VDDPFEALHFPGGDDKELARYVDEFFTNAESEKSLWTAVLLTQTFAPHSPDPDVW
jgi:hypothetical protein